MKTEEWRKVKQIGSLCNRLVEVIDEDVELFIAERPHLVRLVAEKDPWYKPNLEDLETRTRANEIQLKVTKELLREKIDEWLGEDTYRTVEKIFGKDVENA